MSLVPVEKAERMQRSAMPGGGDGEGEVRRAPGIPIS